MIKENKKKEVDLSEHLQTHLLSWTPAELFAGLVLRYKRTTRDIHCFMISLNFNLDSPRFFFNLYFMMFKYIERIGQKAAYYKY